MSTRLLFYAAIAAAAAVVLSGCSGSTSGSTKVSTRSLPTKLGGASKVSEPSGSASSASTSPSKMSMRIVNLFDPSGAPGPALDVYDVALHGQQATPVATNVAYGSVSSYFTPHVPTGAYGQPVVELYALPAGKDPVTDKSAAQGIGGAQDDGSHPQITWVLTADTGSVVGNGPLARLSFSSRVEKGASNGSKAPVAPAPPSGKGEILVDTSAITGVKLLPYLLIDTSCAPPINGDPQSPGVPYIFNGSTTQGVASSYAIFQTTPGIHLVSLVSWTRETTPTCPELTAKQGTTSIDVTSGEQVEAYVYGTADHLRLAVGTLQQ